MEKALLSYTHQGSEELFLITADADVSDMRLGLDHDFNLLRSDVFTAAGDDDVFFTIGNFEISVSGKFADVTGVEPAILHRLSGSGGILVIFLHHRFALNQDLPVGTEGNSHVSHGTSYRTGNLLGEGV